MTNGENVTRIVEQNEDFCILTDDVAETVTIEVSLDWWNKPNAPTVDVLEQIKNEISKQWYTHPKNRYEEGLKDQALKDIQIIDKYR